LSLTGPSTVAPFLDRDAVKGLTLNTVSPSLSDGRLPQKAFHLQPVNRAKTPYPGYLHQRQPSLRSAFCH
jgi:hypothetical protein